MTDQFLTLRTKLTLRQLTLFSMGILLLAASWLVLFAWYTLVTEAMLVPWYCCSLETIPSPGSWQRTVNDFFLFLPGRILPSLIFVLVSIIIFARRMLRAKNRVRLPFIFFFANVILLAAAMVVVEASWAVSNAIAGPRLGGIDAGYHRTWYGIVSHLLLCTLFFILLARLKSARPGEVTTTTRRHV